MKLSHGRKLLQEEETLLRTPVPPTITYSPDPLLPPINASSSSGSAETRKPLQLQPITSPFVYSMSLTILVLLTALFFMAFFSVYISRFSDDDAEVRRRQHHSTSIPPSSSSPRFPSSKGLDPSAVGSLPLIAFSEHAKHPIDCAICLHEFEERQMVKIIPCCRHVFHPECIDKWMASHVSCPLCRCTNMCLVDEVRLSVMQEDTYHGVSEISRRRSTVDESNTWSKVGPVGVRRTRSCSSLGECVTLQRSTSF